MTDAPVAIGVDVGGTGTKAALVTHAGEVLGRMERPTEPHAGTKGIIGVVEDLMRRATELAVRVEAVGVGAAGFVNSETGAITFSPNLTYDDPQVKTSLESRVGLPVTVDNDANAAAWGERAFGSAAGSDHVTLLTLGTGIGSGVIADGRLIRGFTGAGAELGHTIVDPNGTECPCGLRGCLEQLASGNAIARMAKEWVADDPHSSIVSFAGSVESITSEHVAKAARELDETARSVLRLAGKALGIGLSNVVNIFDPEVIVLAGSVVGAGEPYLGPARDELARMNTAQRRRPMRLDVTTLGGDAGILGAATLALEEAQR